MYFKCLLLGQPLHQQAVYERGPAGVSGNGRRGEIRVPDQCCQECTGRKTQFQRGKNYVNAIK